MSRLAQIAKLQVQHLSLHMYIYIHVHTLACIHAKAYVHSYTCKHIHEHIPHTHICSGKLYPYIFFSKKVIFTLLTYTSFPRWTPLTWLFCLFMCGNWRKNGQVVKFCCKVWNHHVISDHLLILTILFKWSQFPWLYYLFVCSKLESYGFDLKNSPCCLM